MASDKRCSVTADQMDSIVAGFAAIRPLYLVMDAMRGQYVADVLAFRGMEWPYGGELSVLTEREAGFVLEALTDTARGVPVRG